MPEYIDEWVPSEAEKQQAKMRLVRLDAEGNPVDGSVQTFRVEKFYVIEPWTEGNPLLDQQMKDYFLNKSTTITLKDIPISDEFRRLLLGEEE